jgi:hypothetical protein
MRVLRQRLHDDCNQGLLSRRETRAVCLSSLLLLA